ncbi:MAG: diaminopimelate decarboxylase [Clostridiales bacterium]|jgi:diaminopimelate decarboxylase|nr:diaminopimelate decarboxylase [Clostridiales bacterium]
MTKPKTQVTDALNFYEGNNPRALAEEYRTPLYVYSERILRQNCRDCASLTDYPNFEVHYSIKANSNPFLLGIAREEGLRVDATSAGEIFIALYAGFMPDEIFFVANNIDAEEMRFAFERGVLISLDSLSQLDLYGSLNPGGRAALRFNPGIGAGHHEKVITGGKDTKFGINPEYIPQVKEILKKHQLRLVGINQHIGSLFMTPEKYLASVESLFAIASQFEGLEFIDLGGGFGIPYRKQEGEPRLDLAALGGQLTRLMDGFSKLYSPRNSAELTFKIEPGRYITAEAGVLLGAVTAVKHNGSRKYIGTDLGFNVLMRPVLYGSRHEFEVYKESGRPVQAETHAGGGPPATIVGNICETGDILAQDISLPELVPGDIIAVLDAGAYGFSMSSNYNGRQRPAELLIREGGQHMQIRRRDSLEDLVRHYPVPPVR